MRDKSEEGKDWGWSKPKDSGNWIGECPKCGLKLYRVMGYWCPEYSCPAGLGS